MALLPAIMATNSGSEMIPGSTQIGHASLLKYAFKGYKQFWVVDPCSDPSMLNADANCHSQINVR